MLVPKNTKNVFTLIKLTVFNWKFRQRLSGFGKIPTDTEKITNITNTNENVEIFQYNNGENL